MKNVIKLKDYSAFINESIREIEADSKDVDSLISKQKVDVQLDVADQWAFLGVEWPRDSSIMLYVDFENMPKDFIEDLSEDKRQEAIDISIKLEEDINEKYQKLLKEVSELMIKARQDIKDLEQPGVSKGRKYGI